MIESIRKSLSRDFRDLMLHYGFKQPRRALDNAMQWLCHAPLTELADSYKAYTVRLATEPDAGFWAQFGPERISTDCDPEKIRVCRQAMGFFSRLNANVTEEQKITQLGEAAARFEAIPAYAWPGNTLEYARTFIRRVIGVRPPPLRELCFRHGPGAVATGERGIQKIYFKETFMKVDAYLGYDSEVLFRLPHQPLRALERSEPITKVIAVPKDATRIRTISCEPLSMQFLQQGIMAEMYRRMFRYSTDHFPFQDQTVSRRAAWSGTCAEAWGREVQPCTIDLSNASDDVKIHHVEELFPEEWATMLLAVRSDAARFPELDRVVPLNTFAPMGAATCFPTEALVFAAIRFAAERSLPYRKVRREWQVVGDDIITPAYTFQPTVDLLSQTGFAPNVSKCCGPAVRFRESCGGEYFEGCDIGISRPRILPQFGRRSANVPTVQLATALSTIGFRTTAQLLADTVVGPVALGNGPAYADPRLKWPQVGFKRYNHRYQRWEQKAMVEIPRPFTTLGAVDGWEPLFNWFTSGWRSETPFSNGRTKSVFTWLPCQDI